MYYNGRAKIREKDGEYSVIIPSKKNIIGFIVLTFSLPIYFFIASSILPKFKSIHDYSLDMFVIVWLIVSIILFIGYFFVLLWGLFGVEKISFNGRQVRFEKTIFGYGIKKVMMRSRLSNFRFERVFENFYHARSLSYWGLGRGKIKFDSGFRTYSFGLGLDDAEARYLAKELNEKTVANTILRQNQLLA